MELKMKKSGEVYNPSLGTHSAPMVEEDSVMSLSEKKDAATIRNRYRAGAISQAQAVEMMKARVIKAAREQAQMDARDWARAKKAEMMAAKIKKWNEKTSKVMEDAILTAKPLVEKYSGVTGDPLTPDGDIPIYGRPAVDWMTIMKSGPKRGAADGFGMDFSYTIIKAQPAETVDTTKYIDPIWGERDISELEVREEVLEPTVIDPTTIEPREMIPIAEEITEQLEKDGHDIREHTVFNPVITMAPDANERNNTTIPSVSSYAHPMLLVGWIPAK